MHREMVAGLTKHFFKVFEKSVVGASKRAVLIPDGLRLLKVASRQE